MLDSLFPPEVPHIDEAVRITLVRVDHSPRNYKDFCEESRVTSRIVLQDYANRRYVLVSLNGNVIRELRFNLKTLSWSTEFDDQRVYVEVEKILE